MSTQNAARTFQWSQGSEEAIRSDALSAALAAWRERCGSAAMPKWNADVLLALPAQLTAMSNVIDIGSGRPPFAYRYFGSGLARMHTFELTRKTTDAIEPEGFRDLCLSQHAITMDARKPCFFLNEIPSRKEGLTYTHTMVRLPFSDDGQHVSQILTVEESEHNPDEMREVFAKCGPEMVDDA